MRKTAFLKILWVLLIVGADRWGKWWALDSLQYGKPLKAFPGLQFTLATNRGTAFSQFSNLTDWGYALLLLTIVIITLYVARLLWRSTDCLSALGYGCILGGALGNIWDRLCHGAIIDFIDVYYQDWHWPIFNIADSFICFGVMILIADLYWGKASHENSSR